MLHMTADFRADNPLRPPSPPLPFPLLALKPMRNFWFWCGAQEVLPLVLRMASDPVPNIRFNVSKTLERMAPCLEVRFFCAPDIPPCVSRCEFFVCFADCFSSRVRSNLTGVLGSGRIGSGQGGWRGTIREFFENISTRPGPTQPDPTREIY